MPTVVHTAAAVLVGSELLSGKVSEANLHALAQTLRALGIRLERVSIVPDREQEIAEQVAQFSSAYDVVFTSGGVGPTHDDVTLEAVALAFGVKAELDPELVSMLKAAYQDKFSEGHLRMALVPKGARLVTTKDIRWPTVVYRNVWVLPGVPEIFRMKLAMIRDELCGPAPFISRAVHTNMDEGELKPLLDRVVKKHPNVEVGSYPKWLDPRYKTKVTFDATSEEQVARAVDHFVGLLPEGEPQTLAE